MSSDTSTPERPLPHTERGRQTRAALLAAARAVFARDGFIATTTTSIAKSAGVANGSFYTHFTDKYEIFVALYQELQEEMLHPGIQDAHLDHSDPVAVIEEATRAYLESYRDNAALMRVFEQVSVIDERFRELRLRRARAFEERNVRGIRRLQREGKADPTLDPELVADALSCMVSRDAYMTFALGLRPAVDFDDLVTTLTTLWVNALRVPRTTEAPDGRRRALDETAAQLRAALEQIEDLRDRT
ncbi:MAG: TetR family transcriptional regulator [Actinophytocola sp.]|uniref:TetR/AcrR family transcriptional regulator n=1 Tax=Actinophytocola sp. TaxID=1872138 RepID=UPI001329609F|nr:TetR/AcrR family transcriptional regulator [Actinophytocola sp.]MPZ80458.1 TetR family transcriptional regulator [Actinophytocola sp.]